MVYVLHISIWETLWYMYSAAAGAFMRYAGGRLGRWGCSRFVNRVAPPGGDGGFTFEVQRYQYHTINSTTRHAYRDQPRVMVSVEKSYLI